MDQDFFEQGEYQQATQPAQQQYNHQFQPDENVWEEAQPQVYDSQMETIHSLTSQNAAFTMPVPTYGSSNQIEVDNEVTRKIREQQERIQQILKQKANKEYEQKQARKEAGRTQIMEFLQKKEKQLEQRKQANIQHERKLLQNTRLLNQTAGWKKVFENVNLKMGEYKGSKPVNRMRESIINKREDEGN